MKETTLVHLIKDGCVLMMHRISKEHDINHGKWIGVGGKFEKGETPEECMRREVREETGLQIDSYRYCGIVTFVSDDDETEYMHLFTVMGFHDRKGNYVHDGKSWAAYVRAAGSEASDRDGDRKAQNESTIVELKKCDEGQLEWLPKEELTRIPHWAGDRIFLPLILDAAVPFFSMKLVYREGVLVHASMNEHNCLVTDRLVLRPWLAEDAEALYHWVKNPKIGPAAGWQPHTDVEESRRIIHEILERPEIYAIVLRDTAQPIGSVGLQNFRLVDQYGNCFANFDERQSEDPLVCTKPGFMLDYMEESSDRGTAVNQTASCGDTGLPDGCRVEASLGYWLAEPFWHQGIMTEAAGAVLAHARRDLGIRRVWADYYEGNDASCAVMKRLGFHFHHIEEDRYLPTLNERRTAIVQLAELSQLNLDGSSEIRQ